MFLPPPSLFVFLLHLSLLCTFATCHTHSSVPPHFPFRFTTPISSNILSLPKLLTNSFPHPRLTSHLTPNNFRKHSLRHSSQHTSQPSLPRVNLAFYTEYHPLDALHSKWISLANYYDSLTATEIGLSYERRPLMLLTVGKTDPANPKRVLFNGLQHAREWVTAAATTYLIEALAVAADHPDPPDKQLSTLLQTVEVLIVPIVNPDGYAYSHQSTPENARYWRKNRRPFSSECPPPDKQGGAEYPEPGGVDLNRNWGKDYGDEDLASTNPCDNGFIGQKAFSEPETRALSNLIRITPGLKAHIDFHAFGQDIIGPWAASNEPPARHCEYDAVGNDMEIAMLTVDAKRYTYGRGMDFKGGLYAAAGVMPDWIHDQYPDTLSYTVELRPDLGRFLQGFALPTDQIVSTSKEALQAAKVLMHYADDPQSFNISANCRAATSPPANIKEQVSNGIALKAGVSVAAILLVTVLLCAVALVVMRKRARTKLLGDDNNSLIGGTAQHGQSLENVCVVGAGDKPRGKPVPLGLIANDGNEPSSDETLNGGTGALELLSTVSNECITPIAVDENNSAWQSVEDPESYGNTVLLDVHNPFFPNQVSSARQTTTPPRNNRGR